MVTVDQRIEDQKNRMLVRKDKQRVTSMLAEITEHPRLNYRVVRPNYLLPGLDLNCVLNLNEEDGFAHYLQDLRDGLDKVLTDGTMPERWNDREDLAYHVQEVVRFYKERFGQSKKL